MSCLLCFALGLLWSRLATAQTQLNATTVCTYPRACDTFLSDDLPCLTLEFARVFDYAQRQDVCALVTPAHGNDATYILSSGVANSRCIADWRGDGRCDLSNNHNMDNCQYDGGDCCLSTCQTNCANEPDSYERNSQNCEYFCGEEALFWCLDDEAVLSPVRQWCAFGQIQAMSRCHLSKLEVAGALQQCILDDRVHGNQINAGPQCGNQTLTCTLQDVEAQNGCHLTKDDCFTRMCCTEAIDNGFIDPNAEVLPSLTALYDTCGASTTDNNEPCFPFMVKCLQETRAAKGGCCSCDPGWGGWRCRDPLCWPKCVHGTCLGPDLCHCEAGWKGAACEHAICDPECIPGQGTCVLPNTCECFYGWGGTSCELPLSEPACVNGDAVAPDVCRCASGWGGRLCDYPLCQSWPIPSPECVHGTCVEPFECECEPGWLPYRPINQTGFDILPFWSQGQDISQETAGSYVKADSRISFLSFWDRSYNSSNAAQCTVPDCAIIVDPRCTECEVTPTQRCLKCEPGFFVDTTIDRCERCSNRFPHCQLCGPEPTGPAGLVVLRCTYCDPLYVLEPMPFGEDPSGRCVSDGPIEFSSPVYHVYKDQQNVTLVVQRSIYALRAEFARPITVLVRTKDGTAHSSSLIYGGELASFEATVANLTFGVDESQMIPVDGSQAWNYSQQLTARFQERIELPIKIFDDVSFHPEYRYFDVELVLPPEQLMGHQGPLHPFVSLRQQETHQAWMMPQNVYRAPILDREDVLSKARVYIWDYPEATAAQTFCTGDCQSWMSRTLVGFVRSVIINARTFDNQPITVSTQIRKDPHFIIKYLPRGEGNEESVGTITTATPTNIPGTYAGRFTPTLPGIYKLQLEQAVPGIFAEYWWHRNIHRNAPQQPDITRIDHVLDFWFPDVTTAPAFVRWKFILHFECIRTARWPYNFGHALGVIASPGTTVRAFFWNDGSKTKHVPEDVIPQKREQMIREDCMTEVPYFICIDLLFHDPVVDPFGFYAFEIEWSTPMAEDLETKLSSSIEIMLYHQNDTDYWGWWPIQQGCLLSSGMNIQGSPFEDFQAISGSARAEFSTVLAMPDSTTSMTVIVDTLGEVRIDLRDILGQPVVGGSMIGSITARLFTLRGVKEMDLPVRWDPTRGFYAASWTPLPPDPIYEDDTSNGRYYRQMVVRLDGNQVQNSPMPITILLAISDPAQSFVMAGDFTMAKAGEPVWYQVRSATLAGRLRVTGGDVYQVLFEGPAHDPLTGDDRFDGTVTDNLNGSYTVNFEIQRPGYYNMRIFLNGVEIGPSPFTSVLIWDDLSAPLTAAFGPGISPADQVHGSPARIIAGVNTSFDISAKDSYDVQYFRGGGMFRLNVPVMNLGPGVNVTFDSGYTSPEDYAIVTDNNDGSYSVEYRLCQAGLTSMMIELYTTEAWRPLGASPFLLQVMRGELTAETSQVHPPKSQVYSGVPTMMMIDLRDACGNNADDDAMQSLYVSLERIEDGTPEALPFRSVRSSPGEVTIYFTPMRRGEHRLVVLGDGIAFQKAPMHFTVMPSMNVPNSREWLLPAIGASSNSTFEISNSPCHAGDYATVKVTARDMWGDALKQGHYAFLVYFWREVEGFRPASLLCEPICEGPAGQARRLAVPDSNVTMVSVKEEVYEFSLMSNVSGAYHTAVSVLRPGAFYGIWYNNPNHSKRVFTEMLRGPLDLNWGIYGPGGTLPSNKYSLQIIGWLRVPFSGRYQFELNSDTGGRVFLNGTEISPSYDSSYVRSGSVLSMEADLEQGYVPLEILYDHWMGETTRNISAFLSLGFGSSTVPFHILQADDMFYEEMLQQPYNPFVHVVNPAIAVHSLEVVGGLRNNSLRGVVGQDVFLRLQSADRFGNLQLRRDPASYLHLRSDPPNVAGRRSNDMLSSQYWRIEPLQSGAWDVIMIPEGPAPAIHNLTFELYSEASADFGGLRPVATTSLLLHLSVNIPVAETSSILCVPPTPWPVGVEVTCSVVPRDVQGNEITGLRRVSMYALPPNASTEENTTAMQVEDPLDVARQFRWFPTKMGLWHLRAEVILLEDITVNLTTWPFEVLPGLSTAHRVVAVQPTSIITHIPFHVPITSYDEYDNPVETGTDIFHMKMTGGYHGSLEKTPMVEYLQNNSYIVSNLSVASRDLFQLHLELLSLRHNNSLSQCPELSPVPGGEIYQLTEQRAIGSRATLRCYAGFAAAGGQEELRCEWPPASAISQVAGYAEWFNLSSLPASGLMCRERPLWCPVPPSVPFGRLVERDWRRQVGSTEKMECLKGHVLLFGDLDIVCGSRSGNGTWLAMDGTEQIPAACMPLQHFCPPLQLNTSFVYAASHGRDPGSVVQLRCNVGLIRSSGDSTLVCGTDGAWRKPLHTVPQPPSEVLQCTTQPNYCPDPSPLLELGARFGTTELELYLNATVSVNCSIGYEASGMGEDTGLCGIDPDDDTRGRWVSPTAISKAQVPWQPLRCRLKQSYCPLIQMNHGQLLSLSKERFLQSTATLGCAEGYEASGGFASFTCRPSTMQTGAWLASDGVSDLTQKLQCSKIAQYCPSPIPPEGTYFVMSSGLEMDSVLTFTCALAYEANVALEYPPELYCLPGGTPGVGRWAFKDGKGVEPAEFLKCRKMYNWCPRLGLLDGRVSNLLQNRQLGSTAELTCDPGLEMKFGATSLGQITLQVNCTIGSTSGGLWMSPDGQDIAGQLQCSPLNYWCPPVTAFTIVNSEYLEMDPGLRTVTYSSPYRAYRSTASVRCREDRLMLHSYGDTDLVCGLDAKGTGGAWRSPRGMLAITKHCFFTGSPIFDTTFIENGCFMGDFAGITDNFTIPVFFERTAGILFWHKPSSWVVGSTVLEGSHGNGRWRIQWVGEGILNARVDAGVGELQIEVTQNMTKGPGDWFHIAFVWDLGVGLAGLGRTYLWVDGIQADPVAENTEKLTHFIWVDPEDLLDIGGLVSPTSPGDYSNIRVYTRAVPEDEVMIIYSSEDPTCGMTDDVCPNPWSYKSYVSRVDNPQDFRYSLFPRRPAAEVFFKCDPGYASFDGDEHIICTSEGTWLKFGTQLPATPYRCCRHTENYCPDIDLRNSPGAAITATGFELLAECASAPVAGPDPSMVEYSGCLPMSLEAHVVLDLSDMHNISSMATLSCEAGYEPMSAMLMDMLLICNKGVFDPVTFTGEVPGVWMTLDGRTPRPLKCRGLQNFCPDPRLPNMALVSLSNGLRTGSSAQMECIEETHGESLEALCTRDPSNHSNGLWVAPQHGHVPVSQLSGCMSDPEENLTTEAMELGPYVPGALWYSDACAIGSAIKMDASVTAAGGTVSMWWQLPQLREDATYILWAAVDPLCTREVEVNVSAAPARLEGCLDLSVSDSSTFQDSSDAVQALRKVLAAAAGDQVSDSQVQTVTILAGASCGARRLQSAAGEKARRLQQAVKVDFVILFLEAMGIEAAVQAAETSRVALEQISLQEVTNLLHTEMQNFLALASITVTLLNKNVQLITTVDFGVPTTTLTTTSITETVVTSTTTMTVEFQQQDDDEDNGSNVSNESSTMTTTVTLTQTLDEGNLSDDTDGNWSDDISDLNSSSIDTLRRLMLANDSDDSQNLTVEVNESNISYVFSEDAQLKGCLDLSLSDATSFVAFGTSAVRKALARAAGDAVLEDYVQDVSIVAGATCGGRRLEQKRRLQEAAKVDYVIQFPESLGKEGVLQAATQSKAALESISLVEVSSILQEEAQKIPSLSSITVSVTGQTVQLITLDVVANYTEEENETNVTIPPLSCLTTPNMIVQGSNLTVQLAEDLGRFTVELTKVTDVGRWLHLAYGWQQGGLSSTLWLNGTSVSLPFTSTRTMTTTSTTETMEMNDTSDAGSDVPMATPSNESMEGPSISMKEIIWKARQEGWIVLPELPNESLTLEDDMDLGTLYFGWPLPSNDFDVTMANDGWRTLFRLYGSSLEASDAADLYEHELPYCPLVLCPRLEQRSLKNVRVIRLPRRALPSTTATLHCLGGFEATNGQAMPSCTAAGTWTSLLECCKYDEDFCPEIPTIWRPSMAAPAQEPENFSLQVEEQDIPNEPCPGVVMPGTSRSIGATLQLRCPPAYVLMAGSSDVRCSRNSSSESTNGYWEDVMGGEYEIPVCDLDDHWCPILQPGHKSYIFNVTQGRRLGSLLFLRCLNDVEWEPDFGSITLRCGMADDRRTGVWVDAFGQPAIPLSCREKVVTTTETSTTSFIPTRAGVISGLPGDQGLNAVKYHAANATLSCGYPFVNVGGDENVFCVIGPAETADGTGGRWVDADGSNIELPICVFRRDWCPQLALQNLFSEASLSSAYEYGSVATLRCHIGYQRVEGNVTLNCINHESLLFGIWDGEPLRCELSPYFCPAPLATNAKLVELDTEFRRDDVVNLECHTGFTYLEGDLKIYCNVSDDHDGGQWKVSDGTVAKPVVCVPQQDFCSLPVVTNGYVYNVTEQGTMGSVVELHCQDGFQDSRLHLGQRTALCSDMGRFQVGISRVSRDLIRATNLVQDVLDELEAYWAMDTRESDTNWRALMQFEYRWRTELRQGLEGLPDGSAVQEVLFQVPNYDGVTDKWLAMYTVEDVRNLKRMLEQKQLEMLDLVDLQQGQQSPQPLLDCNRTPAWCPLPPLPPHSQFTTVNAQPVALGETISMECHPHYVTDLGIQELLCGNSINGSSQWIASDGGGAAVPLLTCTLNRSWCPSLPSFSNAAVVALEPLNRAVHSEVRLACRRGYRPLGGHTFGRCSLNGAWCSMADDSSDSCVEPADWLRCELIPAYCPEWPGYGYSVPYNSSIAPKVIPVIDPLAHVFLREVRQLPLPSGVLGDIVTVACPEEFVRSSGDTRFKCGHGLHGRGQWQREVAMLPQYTDNSTPDAIIHLVDEATAEPLVCELETMKGVRRNYFDRLPGLFRNHTDRAGYDVVPYINQFHSPYDAAQFESYLRPKLEGNYTLSLDVVGSFVLTWGDQILLAARSSGLEAEIFNSTELDLSAGSFYFFHLEYWADPILPERTDQEMLTFPRRLRLLWSGPVGEMQPVPFTELYHTFDEVYGYPITARSINDPNPCDSVTQVTTIGIAEGDNGTIQDGTIGFDYNEDLNCEWRLEAIGNVRYTIFSNFFDLVNTSNCAGDRLEFYVAAGNTERFLGKVCGFYPQGTALIHVVSRSIVLKFITDDTSEREGFNITWNVTNQAVTLTSNPIVSGQIV